MVAELIGTCLLVACVIGSGIMGDSLSPDNAGVALLGNAIATWGILYVLITVFGPVSGAHFNPVVTAAFFLFRDGAIGNDTLGAIMYALSQFGGGILGTIVAHAMFNLPAIGNFADAKNRDSPGELFGEIVATFGLLLTIFGTILAHPTKEQSVPLAVGLYITAGYWFTSSTSFANPAVAVARCFTDTFASINPRTSLWRFLVGQLVGLVVALPFLAWMYEGRGVLKALAVLVRR